MSDDYADRLARLSPAKRALLERLSKAPPPPRERSDRIAIVGMACRLPGGADTLDGYWSLLADGVDTVKDIPRDRWDVDVFYDPDPDAPGRTYARRAAVLDSLDRFDAEHFGISPREAAAMDPQQRLILEVAWSALEDAGIAPLGLAGSRTGVYVGIFQNGWFGRRVRDFDVTSIDAYTGIGTIHSIAVGRLSYLLDLRGPSIPIDTVCSSSLVALHLACDALRRGEIDLAIVGGVNATLSVEMTISLSKMGALSPRGRCAAFDASADGFVQGEGCGMLVLERESDADSARRNVWAIVRGTAVNHEGRSSGLTAPNGPAQTAVIRDALKNAGVAGADVSYVETHGTGTALGDPIEARALADALGPALGRGPVTLGSVKSNIGHLESAAGVASIIKVALAMKHERIPRNLHFDKPNPLIAFDTLGLRVAARDTPWPRTGRARIAGISGFGMAGTNAHVILEEPRSEDVEDDDQPPSSVHEHVLRSGTVVAPRILALSARTDDALWELAARWERALEDRDGPPFDDACFTLARGRSHLRKRVAIIAEDRARARSKLSSLLLGKPTPGVVRGEATSTPRVAFLFTGQGSQVPGMGRALYASSPVFRAALDRCAEILRSELELPLLDVLFGRGDDPDAIHRTAFTQPALLAFEWALTEWYRAHNVEPVAVLGHSLGEYTAATVAGVIPIDEALRLVTARGRLSEELPPGDQLAAVFTTEANVRDVLAAHDRVAITGINAPENIVIGGPRAELEAVLAELSSRGVGAKTLELRYAPHTASIDPILDRFERRASRVQFQPARIPIVSNLTGEPLKRSELDAAYLRRHLRNPVLFARGVQSLAALGVDALVEIGPAATLIGLARATLDDPRILFVPSLRRDREEPHALAETLATLWSRGVPVDLTGSDTSQRRFVSAPTTPFAGTRFWPEPAVARRALGGHPFIARSMRTARGELLADGAIGPAQWPALADHRVDGSALIPAAATIDLLLTVAGATALEQLEITTAIESDAVQVRVDPDRSAEVHLVRGERFVPHARARIADARAHAIEVPECSRPLGLDEAYAIFGKSGVEVGPRFRRIRSIALGERAAVATIAIDPSELFTANPIAIDAALQVLAIARLSALDDAAIEVPVGAARVDVAGKLKGELRVVARMTDGDAIGDVYALDESGRVVLAIEGVRVARPEVSARPASTYRVELVPIEPRPGEAPAEALVDTCALTAKDPIDACLALRDALQKNKRLFVVTRGAFAEPPDPTQAAIAAFARVIAREHPDLFGRIIDLEDGDLSRLPRELADATDEEVVVLRGSQRLAPRLAPIEVTGELAVRSDRSYLITGGLGGLGLAFARSLVDRGARALALVGRSAPDDAARAAIAELEARGAKVLVLSADVARAEDVDRIVAAIARELPPLVGIVHSAGVVADATLSGLDRERFERVFAPKVRGALELHRATRELELDFFVLFASAVGALSLAGQGNYVAANAWLDAYAAMLRAEGVPATAIDWGPFASSGLAATKEARASASRRGMRNLTLDEGARFFAGIAGGPHARVVVVTADWPRFARTFGRGSAFLPLERGLTTAVDRALLARLASESDVQRRATLRELVEKKIRELLGARDAALDARRPLAEQGVDSLVAVDLRVALGQALDRRLPAALIANHPTLDALVERLFEEQPWSPR